jgi:hypothetical protein
VKIKVYFLGLWDCVNSVAVLESEPPVPVSVQGTATYIRHAVAVDEFRVKFKPALFVQDSRDPENEDDIKEVWFPGNHGDVGGGWPASPPDAGHRPGEASHGKGIPFWFTHRATTASKDVKKDDFQLSDVPLAWMIRELELVGEKNSGAAIKWSPNKKGFHTNFRKKIDQAKHGFMHDTLRFGYGSGFFSVLLWKFLGMLSLLSIVISQSHFPVPVPTHSRSPLSFPLSVVVRDLLSV